MNPTQPQSNRSQLTADGVEKHLSPVYNSIKQRIVETSEKGVPVEFQEVVAIGTNYFLIECKITNQILPESSSPKLTPEGVQEQLLPALNSIARRFIEAAESNTPPSFQEVLDMGRSHSMGEAAQFLMFEFVKDGANFPTKQLNMFAAGDDNALRSFALHLANSVRLGHFKS